MARAAKKAPAAKPAQDKGAASAAPVQPAADAGAAAPSTTGAEDLKPLGGEVAGQATGAATVDPTGTPSSSADAGEGTVQAGAPESSSVQGDTGAATQPVGDLVPPPVAEPASVPVRPSVSAAIEMVAALSDRGLRAAVEVTGPRSGRRRAGRQFGREPVQIPLDELGADELNAIDADPALSWAIVELVDSEKPE